MPSIEQFRTVVSNIARQAKFKGLDEDNQPIIDHNASMPIIDFTGTVKLHGTNASIVSSPDGEVYAQSKKNVLSLEKDNFGFAAFVEGNKDVISRFMASIRAIFELEEAHDVKLALPHCGEYHKDSHITIYGEWCGEGIQKTVALSQLPKMFVVFGCKFTRPEGDAYWVVDGLRNFESFHLLGIDSFKNIFDFENYSMSIDFSNPKIATSELERIALEVEAKCPVAAKLGVDGIGEGVVWTGWFRDTQYMFKVKGDKHSTSKIKKIVSISPEKIASIDEFIEYACTDNRFNQAMTEVFGEEEPDKKRLGDLIRWFQSDIIKEETDVLTENGLIYKDVAGVIAKNIRDRFFLLK